MNDYPAFLAARLDDEEAEQLRPGRQHPRPDLFWADIAAKRQILYFWRVADHKSQTLTHNLRIARVHEAGKHVTLAAQLTAFSQEKAFLESVIKVLSGPFRDHPDYPKDK